MRSLILGVPERSLFRAHAGKAAGPVDPGMGEFVAERLRKLRASRKDAVLNSIGAMFQFRGGISEQDKERCFRPW